MFEHLFEPITINGMTLKNRIIAAPTGDLFERKALGGAGLVIAGHAIVEPGKSSFSSKDEDLISRQFWASMFTDSATQYRCRNCNTYFKVSSYGVISKY